MIYLFFFLIVFTMLVAGSVKNIRKETYIFVPLLFLAILTGLRYETGSDLINYQSVFERVSVGRYIDYEITYTLICMIVQFIHGKFQLVVFIYSLASYFFIYKALCKFCKSKLEAASFICFFYSIMFSTYFILMRQFLAASIILFAISRNDKNKIVQYILFAIAGLFHYGAFVVIPFYIIINSKLLNKNWKRLIALGFIIVIGKEAVSLEVVKGLLNIFSRYEYYTGKTNYGTSTTISATIIIFTLIYVVFSSLYMINETRKGTKADDWVLVVDSEGKGILLTFIIYFGTVIVGWFHRSYWYTYMFVAFLPAWSSQFFLTKKSKQLYLYIWIVISMVYTVYFYQTLQYTMPNMFPYKWSLELF